MSAGKESIPPQQIRKIQELAEQLQFGSLSLIFQNGKLIQIDRNEKIRLDRTGDKEIG